MYRKKTIDNLSTCGTQFYFPVKQNKIAEKKKIEIVCIIRE